MSSLPNRSMTRTLADTVASRVSAAGMSFQEWSGRRILLANLVVLAVVACFALLYRSAAALFILFVGISLGMAVKPGVEWLRRRGIRRWAGALAIYAALGCLCAGVLMLAVPVIADQAATLVARAPTTSNECGPSCSPPRATPSGASPGICRPRWSAAARPRST